MIITLYLNSAEDNRIDKSSYLTEVVSLSGTLREGTSIVTPAILVELAPEAGGLIEANGEDVLAGAEEVTDGTIGGALVPRFNYAFIPQFHRYYFLADMIAVNKSLYYLSLTCDPLMSFKEEFLDLEGLIARQEFDYNPLLKDERRVFLPTKQVTSAFMAKGSLVNISFAPESLTDANRSFILSTLVKKESNSLIPTFVGEDYTSPIASLPSVKCPHWFDAKGTANVYCVNKANIEPIASAAVYNDALTSFIIGCIALPFEIPADWFALDGMPYPIVIEDRIPTGSEWSAPFYKYAQNSPYLVIADETFSAPSSFIDLDPYTSVEFKLPYYGSTTIPYARIAGKRIIVYYVLNMFTGSASVHIFDYTTGVDVFSADCQLGKKIEFSTTNIRETDNAKTASAMNTLLSVIGSAVSIGAGIVSSNPVAIAGGVIAGTRAVTGAINTEINAIERGSAHITDILTGVQSPQDVIVSYIRSIPVIADDAVDFAKYAHDNGLPLEESRKLRDLTGYTEVKVIHLEHLTATRTEIASIESSLMRGVLL